MRSSQRSSLERRNSVDSDHASPHPGRLDDSPTQALIPGAYERNTLTHRQAGSMSGPAYGSSDQPIGPSLLDAATTAAREMEGGGGISQRPRRIIEPLNRGTAAPIAANEGRPTSGPSWLRFWRLLRR